ncbi:MAG: hypothetical protein ABS28_09640 [Cryomorphaceae bacterium BACL22 MAG-120619-bin32]|jgi:sialate O-acetylesterase|nr:MAG: hypothetical protein ABS28_09640 [Cryomorphaceae bacterium BACL22 MAG-120619-bin32]
MEITKESNMKKFLLVIIMSLLISSLSYADVKLPTVFSSNMVLQREIQVPVWGWADPGEEVTVNFSGQSNTVKADADGKWMVKLSPMPAGGPFKMTVRGNNTIIFTNVMIGEVWVCSGQSNMEFPVEDLLNGDEEICNSNHPNIRLFNLERNTSGQLLDDCEGFWEVCSPDAVDNFSAVAYFFGRYVNTELDVPIGLINTSWGGTLIEPWTPVVGFKSVPKLQNIRDEIKQANAEFKDNAAKSLDRVQQWVDESRVAIKTNKDIPNLPKLPKHPLDDEDRPTCLFNAMVNPIVPFGIRGTIWYQGEANRKDGLGYFLKMQALINGWRDVWNQGDFPFYIVQLAPFRYDDDELDYLPLIWEAQRNVLSLKNTGMAVTIDIGNLDDIHPKNKQDVGKRLALWALAKDYGRKDLIYSGPLYKSMSVEGSKVRISFDYAATGLESKDGQPLSWFSIAGADMKFVDAVAEIDGNTVLVSSVSVTNPVAVRFGWSNLAQPNLSNNEGLPASPFRTDLW